MRFVFLAVLITLCGALNGQVLHSAKVEVVGRPAWYEAISLGKEGVILVLKEDQTKFKVLKLDSILTKRWEQDLFLDTEKRPAAMQVTNEKLTLLFSETGGMFYQLLEFSTSTGEFKRYGFEVLEFFKEEQVLTIGSKVVLIGSNLSGLAYYVYDLETEQGKLVETQLKGKVAVEQAKLMPNGNIELLATVQTLGYVNEARQKGAYVKNSEVFFGQLDISGKVLEKKIVKQDGGRFPMTAQMNLAQSGVSGVYQATDGSKGFYYSTFSHLENKPSLFIPFTQMFSGLDNKRLRKEPTFYTNRPVNSEENVYSGVFMLADKLSRSQEEPIQTAVISFNGQIENIYKIVLTEVFSERSPTLAINPQGNIAYISNGKLLVKNLETKNMPLAYKLSDEAKVFSEPQYTQVNHWYENLFLGIGIQNKEEAIKLTFNEKTKKKRKKKNRMETFTQIRKTYFVTAIKAD